MRFGSSQFAQQDIAGRIACTETTDQAKVAGVQIFAVLAEGDDRTRRAGVCIFAEDVRLLMRFGRAAQNFAADKIVHADIGLMEPHAFEVSGVEAFGFHMVEDELRNHRHDFFENLAAFLHEEFVFRADAFRCGAIEEAEIVADIVREFRNEF